MNLNSKILVAAAAALAFAACQKTEITENQVADCDQTRYIKVAIVANTAETRATDTDFQTSLTEEMDVDAVTFVFYDRSKLPVGKPVRLEAAELTFDPTTGAYDGNVGKIIEKTVPVTLQMGENLPQYVMAFINPADDADYLSMSLTDLEEDTTNNIFNTVTNSTKATFLMSNSVYFGDNVISGEKGVRLMATPILSGALAASETEAEAVAATEIYVERYAAKVGLSAATGMANTPVTGDGYTLRFQPEYWTVNAVDKEVFRTKTFGAADGTGISFTTLTEAQVNAALAGWSGWNDANNSRCYWANSIGYYASSYPLVTDNVVENQNENHEATNYTEYTEYKSYNDIKAYATNSDLAITKRAHEFAAAGNVLYARETTADATKYTVSKNPKAALASVVVVGKYADATFYLLGDCTPDADNKIKAKKYDSANELGKAFLAIQNVLSAKDGDSYSFIRTYSADMTIAHPSWEVSGRAGNAIISDQYVTLQLKQAPDNAYFYDGSNYVQVTADNLDDVNAIIMRNVGFARCFTDGKAYFNIPIQHLNWDATTMMAADGKVNWENVVNGAFGVVRNHVYDIQISGIKGLASGISGLDRPIVPPVEENTYYISTKINILNWRIVPTQKVEL